MNDARTSRACWDSEPTPPVLLKDRLAEDEVRRASHDLVQGGGPFATYAVGRPYWPSADLDLFKVATPRHSVMSNRPTAEDEVT
jgi:hypothetical protein